MSLSKIELIPPSEVEARSETKDNKIFVYPEDLGGGKRPMGYIRTYDAGENVAGRYAVQADNNGKLTLVQLDERPNNRRAGGTGPISQGGRTDDPGTDASSANAAGQ